MTQTRKTDMPFASFFTASSTLEVPFASVPSVFRGSAILRFCDVRNPRYLQRFPAFEW